METQIDGKLKLASSGEPNQNCQKYYSKRILVNGGCRAGLSQPRKFLFLMPSLDNLILVETQPLNTWGISGRALWYVLAIDHECTNGMVHAVDEADFNNGIQIIVGRRGDS